LRKLPNTSKLKPEAENMILTEPGILADRVGSYVFESVSKHPQDVKQREQTETTRAGKS